MDVEPDIDAGLPLALDRKPLGLDQPSPTQSALQIFRWMQTARRVDAMEYEMIARGEAFFHVSGAGHEAVAALASLLRPDDYLHCHYRDKALLIARGVPIVEFFDSLLCTASSHSAGRQMSAHLSAPALNVLSLVGPVGNNALQAVGVAHEIKDRPQRPLVLCSIGDGTAQQGEALEAIAEAVRWRLPVLFLIEDNGYSISTKTAGKTFFSTPDGDAASFYGLPIHRLDGADPMACHKAFRAQVDRIRETRGPAICLMRVARLSDHTNADDEAVYRDAAEIEQARATRDPLVTLRGALIGRGVAAREIEVLEETIDQEVRSAAALALDHAGPQAGFDPAPPLAPPPLAAEREYRGTDGGTRLAMGAALRGALQVNMQADTRITLYGEDIEDPKGDVFGVTRGLTKAFPGRVLNSPLSESTIVGTSIGRALAGGRPVAFLQFADFMPLAFNQLASELGSLAWRTQGAWKAPVIVMAACGGYRPGLGPFHASTFESILAHLPGIDVVMPSSAADAAGALNTAFRSERPTIILYPKALLNDSARSTSSDVARQSIALGRSRVAQAGRDLTIVAWGNTVPLCEKAAATLATVDVYAEIVDLRWLAPWDRDAVCASARKSGRLLVVHEDNLTAGFGAEVVASVSEAVGRSVQCRRIARPDTYVPCHFGAQLDLLPSYRSILTAAAEMCDLDLSWRVPPEPDAERFVVNTIGSSPADQTVLVAEMLVKVGDRIKAGQAIAALEADKAVIELASPADGVVETIHLSVGDRASVDAPLMTLRVRDQRRRQPLRERSDIAHLRRRRPARSQALSHEATQSAVVVTGIAAVRGRATLDNSALFDRLPSLAVGKRGADGILERTGIESRLVADASQTVVSMAAEAATLAFAKTGMTLGDLDLVICSTSTPSMVSPSTACQVLHALDPSVEIPAYDVQAACSGYLYALANAWDFLKLRPNAKVLVLTSETMRQVVDIDDPDTSPLFADAASATLLMASADGRDGLATLHRPVLSARGESGAALSVPLPGAGNYVRMDGEKIFAEGIRRMEKMLEQSCAQVGLTVADLDLIVPHQANGRMIEAMRSRLKLPSERVWNEIRHIGNTSSSSIPLALDTVFANPRSGDRIGLCAFGAGFTFGGAVLDRRRQA